MQQGKKRGRPRTCITSLTVLPTGPKPQKFFLNLWEVIDRFLPSTRPTVNSRIASYCTISICHQVFSRYILFYASGSSVIKCILKSVTREMQIPARHHVPAFQAEFSRYQGSCPQHQTHSQHRQGNLSLLVELWQHHPHCGAPHR